MNHQGFFGTAIKRNSKKINSIRGEETLNNKLFANDNLRKIQLPKQLTQQNCFPLEQGVQLSIQIIYLINISNIFVSTIHGIRLETKSPSKQFRISNHSKQNIENTSFQPESLKFSYNQQYLVHDISPLIRIRRLQLDRVSQNQKQLTVGQQCFDFLTNKRIRAQSFAEERCLSPDQKKNRPRLNLLNQRNLYSESFRLQDNQLENY